MKKLIKITPIITILYAIIGTIIAFIGISLTSRIEWLIIPLISLIMLILLSLADMFDYIEI